MLESNRIFAEIVEMWKIAQAEHRDRLLEIGEHLHLYLLAKISEARQVDPQVDVREVRSTATNYLAAKMETTRIHINELLRTAAIVRLLGVGGLGGLSYSALREFKPLVVRPQHRLSVEEEPEQWVVRKPVEDHIALFRKIAAEGWSCDEVRSKVRPIKQEVADKHGQGVVNFPGGPRSRGKAPEERAYSPTLAVAQGSPRDVAEMIGKLVEAATDPKIVAELVLGMCQQILSNRKVVI